MTNKPLSSLLLIGSLFALGACTDPVVGDWESSDVCGRAKMTVEDDNTGDGYTYMIDGTGSCIKCDFTFDWDEDGDNRYKVDLDFENCNCNNVTTGDADCRINDDGDRLTCDGTVGTCPLGESEWDKRD